MFEKTLEQEMKFPFYQKKNLPKKKRKEIISTSLTNLTVAPSPKKLKLASQPENSTL